MQDIPENPRQNADRAYCRRIIFRLYERWGSGRSHVLFTLILMRDEHQGLATLPFLAQSAQEWT